MASYRVNEKAARCGWLASKSYRDDRTACDRFWSSATMPSTTDHVASVPSDSLSRLDREVVAIQEDGSMRQVYMRRSASAMVREKRDQDDDWNRYTNQIKQNGAHSIPLLAI